MEMISLPLPPSSSHPCCYQEMRLQMTVSGTLLFALGLLPEAPSGLHIFRTPKGTAGASNSPERVQERKDEGDHEAELAPTSPFRGLEKN